MSVDYSVEVFYGIILDVTHSEWLDEIDPNWSTHTHHVEIGQFGDCMGGTISEIVAFYQPSYRAYNRWDNNFGVFPLKDLKKSIDVKVARKNISKATKNLKTKGKPRWFMSHTVS